MLWVIILLEDPWPTTVTKLFDAFTLIVLTFCCTDSNKWMNLVSLSGHWLKNSSHYQCLDITFKTICVLAHLIQAKMAHWWSRVQFSQMLKNMWKKLFTYIPAQQCLLMCQRAKTQLQRQKHRNKCAHHCLWTMQTATKGNEASEESVSIQQERRDSYSTLVYRRRLCTMQNTC